MTHEFAELEEKMNPESRARVGRAVQEALNGLPLDELRNARGLSRKMLAEALGIQQPAIAKIEKRTDMYISALRSHIEAMGEALR
jgi:ribosome-binding protein aMBF1 (putative translation factor)